MEAKSIRGNSLSFLDINKEKNKTVLLVHGHPFDHSMWKYQYETLKDFRIINPDLFGYGKSEAVFDKIFIEQQALDLALLLDELQVENVHLVGLSMGGQIIVEFARLFPHRSKSLVICASTPNSETSSSFKSRLNKAAEIEQFGMLKHTQETISNYININLHPPGSEVYDHLFQMMSKTPDSGAVASHRGRAERRNNFSFLGQLTIPTLVVAGELDYFFKVSDVKDVADSIPNSTFISVEQSGHLPNMENTEAFNQALNDFYNSI